MARFPKAQARVAQLAQDMISGLRGNPDVFPNSPAEPSELEELLRAFVAAREDVHAAEAAAAEARAAKAGALETLRERMKDVLRYAEQAVKHDDPSLRLLGWGAPRPRTQLQPPGQAGTLTAAEEGDTWVRLTWTAPPDGGKVAAYRILRREGNGPWADVGMAVEPSKKLDNQPTGVVLAYEVIAVNKAGEGEPSNVARVVL